MQISVRPEKVRFVGAADNGIEGTVRTRIFQGNHWLYQADALGRTITIIQQNDGGASPKEGDAVRIGWRAEDMRVRARPAGAA